MPATVLPTQLAAAGSAAVQGLIRGRVRPGERLGAFPAAIYVRLPDSAVLGVLTSDAARLPLGLVLATSSTDHPLDRLDGPILVGSSQVRIGQRAIRLTRLLSVRAPIGLTPNAAATRRVRATLRRQDFAEHDPELLDALGRVPHSSRDLAHALIGAGSGLTPSGDDVLAGYLVAARSFSVDAEDLRTEVAAMAPGRTTDLSAALLAHACQGDSIPQVHVLLAAWSAATMDPARVDGALADLLRVGLTSGIAVASGILAAARTFI